MFTSFWATSREWVATIPVLMNTRPLVRPHSNEHEMFYINLENAMPGSDYFDGILAHELQHMIHWAMDRNEDSWVNEGLSELAAQVNGYDVGGSDYAFSLTPDTQLTAWTALGDSAPHYGASYLFLAYFLGAARRGSSPAACHRTRKMGSPALMPYWPQ